VGKRESPRPRNLFAGGAMDDRSRGRTMCARTLAATSRSSRARWSFRSYPAPRHPLRRPRSAAIRCRHSSPAGARLPRVAGRTSPAARRAWGRRAGSCDRVGRSVRASSRCVRCCRCRNH